MIPVISTIQNRPTIRGSIDFSGYYGVEVGVTMNGGKGVIFRVMKMLMMEAQL